MKLEYVKPSDQPVRALQLSEQIKQVLGYDTKIQVSSKKIMVWFDQDLTVQEQERLSLVIASYEYAPLPLSADMDFLLQSRDGSVWRVTISDQGVLQTVKV